MCKVKNKYTKNNINYTALLLALNITLIFLAEIGFLLKNKIEAKQKLTHRLLLGVEDNLYIG